jgi:hypothetical protein
MSDFEQLTQKYKKKTEFIDDRSTPEARGARVKRVRNLANLSRKEMGDDPDLNMFTLKGWELARHGGLPLDGAHKIVKRVAREGVFCTVEWLLYEEGQPPKVVVGKTNDQVVKEIFEEPEEIKMQEELTFFQKQYSSTIYYQISDDGMLPFYEKGDMVAGVPEMQENIQNIIGMNCIVQLTSGEVLCRKIRRAKSDTCFNLVCINSDTEVENPIIADAELISATPIIWHRKPRKKQ